MHCVDLGKSFHISIYLQKLASVQPITSPVKFAHSPCTDPPGMQSVEAGGYSAAEMAAWEAAQLARINRMAAQSRQAEGFHMAGETAAWNTAQSGQVA